MTDSRPTVVRTLGECVARISARLGQRWVVACPLGLGKPNHLVNAIYRAAREDPDIRLELFTALSLNPPLPASGLKQRFLGPFVARHFGDYPRLEYLADLDRNAVPANVRISEFYFRSGTRLHDSHAQRHYVASNYTHVARDMAARNLNLLVQMVAVDPSRPGRYSLASNPDVTLELLEQLDRDRVMLVAQVNEDLPYMTGECEVAAETFDLVLEGHPQPLFSVPRMPVSDQDRLLGLHASRLIRDGGTLQLGIGSLGDAVCACALLRHQHNDTYREMVKACAPEDPLAEAAVARWGGSDRFDHGLYAASEMFTEGFLHLYQGSVLKRQVFDDENLQRRVNDEEAEPAGGILLHSAFFLGSKWMYETLRAMPFEERGQFRMTGVRRVNQLYQHETLDRLQRTEGRFMNTTMKMTLLGAAASDQLEDGQVVSGVGGQYNFVAMAHALDRARSVLMLRSNRWEAARPVSNIVWEFPHATIPRHLRDLVVTEYGIADLRSASDEEVIQRLLCITDSRWQEPLRLQAVRAGKLEPHWRPPENRRHNTPQRVKELLQPWRSRGVVSDYPFGSDFSETEMAISRALTALRRRGRTLSGRLRLLLEALGPGGSALPQHGPELERMGLIRPASAREMLDRRLLCVGLKSTS